MKKADLEKLVKMGSFSYYHTEPDGRVFVRCVVCGNLVGLRGHRKDCLKACFEAEQHQKQKGGEA